MAKHPAIFPPIMLSLIRAGETGGFLEGSLESIANNFEAELKLIGTIKSALTYPVVVLLMAVVAVAGMLIFIVPIFKTMFNDLGSELPLPDAVPRRRLESRCLVVGPIVVVAAVAFGVWWRKNKHTEQVRKFVDPLKLKLPVFGPLLTKVAIARLHPQLRHHDGVRRSDPPLAHHRRRDIGQLGHRTVAAQGAGVCAAGRFHRGARCRRNRSSRPWSPR